MVLTEENQYPHLGHLIEVYNEASRIAHHLDDPDLTPVLKGQVEDSALPLAATETHFAADSLVLGDTARDCQTGGQRSVRAYFVCGVRTGVVTAVEFGGPDTRSGLLLPELLQTTMEHFPKVEKVTASRAYLSKFNLETASELGLRLYIPFKPNSKLYGRERLRSRAWEQAFYFYQNDYAEFMEHYRSHSVVEDVVDAIEDRTGTFLHAKTEAGRVNEVLLKILAHNAHVVAEAEQEGLLDEQAAGLTGEVGSAG